MQRLLRLNTLWNGLVPVCAFGLLFTVAPAAEAKSRRHQHHDNAFTVALQPFEMVHTAVHAVAAPIVQNAPRVVAAEPIRIAYYSQRPPRAEPVDVVRGEAVDDYQESEAAPRAELAEAEPESEPQIDNRGSKPTVSGSVAVLRNGVAYAPSQAPQAVKNAIWAVNSIR